MQTRPRQHPLIAHVLVDLQQVAEQFDLQGIARSEIGVSALCAERMMSRAIPIQSRFTQARTCGNDRGIAGGLGRAHVERQQIAGGKSSDTVRVSFQVIEQPDRCKPEFVSEFLGVDDPRQVGRFDVTVDFRAGNPEARMFNVEAMLDEKQLTICSSPAYSRLEYVRSATTRSALSRTSNNARRVEVPPMSPAKIIA